MSVGEFSPAVVALITTRDRACCARCGKALHGMRGRDWSIHHRRPRGSGGTSLAWVGMAANGLAVCGSGVTGCHGRIERNRRASFDAGFLVSAIGVALPVNTRVKHAIHGWVLLDNDGGFEPAEEYGDDWSTPVEADEGRRG